MRGKNEDWPFDMGGAGFGKFARTSQAPIRQQFWDTSRQGPRYGPEYAIAGRQEAANERGIREGFNAAFGGNNASPMVAAATSSMRSSSNYPGLAAQAVQNQLGQQNSLREQWAAMQQRRRNWQYNLQQLQVQAEQIAATQAQAQAMAGL